MTFLKQSKKKGISFNTLESRFDDLGGYLFSSAEKAMAVVDEYYYR